MTSTPIPESIEQARQRFRGEEGSALGLTQACLERIAARDGEIRAFTVVDDVGSRRTAQRADEAYQRERERGDDPPPLAGLPLSIKDNIDVAGFVSGCGHAPRHEAGSPAAEDAPAVARLREAGAVLLGKAQMHQYALGITGRNDALGTPENPAAPGHLPGGSSSGSGASVAAGLALGSVGSDTGGSVRVPAALCGLVGLKPSFGAIPRGGLFPLSDSMDHVGVLTPRVAGARRLFRVLAGSSPRARSVAPAEPRLALLGEFFGLAAPEVCQVLAEACGRLATAGAVIEERALPGLLRAPESYGRIVVHEASRLHARELETSPDHFGDDLRELFRAGLEADGGDYQRALEERLAFAATVTELLSSYDALIAPTTLVAAPPLDAEEVPIGEGPQGRLMVGVREALLLCTCPFSMIGFPAMSLPAGVTAGLPVGLQIIGPRDDDEGLLALAEWIEARLG